jgi:hypothetical protein
MKFDGKQISNLEQSTKVLTDHFVPYVSSIFRAFCAQDGVKREEALAFTISLVTSQLGQLKSRQDGSGDQKKSEWQ